MEKYQLLKIGVAVRFTEIFLARVDPATNARYRGRVGQVTGYRMGSNLPIVTFPKDGRREELKIFEVETYDLEIV